MADVEKHHLQRSGVDHPSFSIDVGTDGRRRIKACFDRMSDLIDFDTRIASMTGDLFVGNHQLTLSIRAR